MANLYTENFTASIGTWNEVTAAANFTTTYSSTDGGVLVADVTTGGANIAVASHTAGNGFAVTAGNSFTVAATCKQVDGTARAWQLTVNYYTAGGASVTVGGVANVVAAAGTLTVGSFVTLTSSALVVPDTATKCRLRVRWDAPALAETFHLTNARADDAIVYTTGDHGRYVLTGSGWVQQYRDVIV